jgi:hypothetical protein
MVWRGCYDTAGKLEVVLCVGDNGAVISLTQRARCSRPRRRPAGLGCLRWLTLGALMFGTPVIQQALTEAVVLFAEDDCGCEDDCNEDGECPGPCQTCLCCPHSNALSVAALGMLARSGLRAPLRFEPDERDSEGHLASPFRPPIG